MAKGKKIVIEDNERDNMMRGEKVGMSVGLLRRRKQTAARRNRDPYESGSYGKKV